MTDFIERTKRFTGRRLIVLLVVVCMLPSGMIWGQQEPKLHFDALVADTHNDILTTICTDSTVDIGRDMTGKTYSDLARFKKGGLDWQIFSVWCDGNMKDPYQWANREIDSLYSLVKRNPGQIEIAYTAADVKRIWKSKKIVAMTGVEGGHMIEDDLDKLNKLYDRGVRYMTLTWNNSTAWATSAMDETASPQPLPKEGEPIRKKGLTDFGKSVVRRMNELGMMVDLSHVGEQTFWDAIQTTTKPVLVSHSCAWTLCPVFRNLKDEQIKAVGKNGGVICVNFFSGFVDSTFMPRAEAFNKRHQAERDSILKTVSDPYFADTYLFTKYREEVEALRPPLSMLIDHIDYMVKLAGVDHVGLGSDFDGINSSPKELDDVTTYPVITKALLARGYSKKDIRKILGGNLMRVFEKNNPAR